MLPFREAVEAWDFDAVPALLAPDVVFRSPVVFKAYEGRAMVAILLRAVSAVFEDFRYEREFGSEDDSDHVLEFKARVGDVQVHGVDILKTDDAGLVTELVVMLRPLSAVNAVAAAMKAQLEA